MALAQTVGMAHLPPDYAVHVACFTGVTNAAHLKAQLLAGNAAFEYAFVDAGTLVSPTHLLAAVFRACRALVVGRLRTRNVHSETVFCLSPTNNIADSFNRFGLSAETSELVAVKVSHPANTVSLDHVRTHLGEVVQGTSVAFDAQHVETATDWSVVKKIYKLTELRSKVSNGADSQGVTPAERQAVENSVLGMMAIKGS